MFMGSSRDWALMGLLVIVGGVTVFAVGTGIVAGLLYLLYRGVMAVLA